VRGPEDGRVIVQDPWGSAFLLMFFGVLILGTIYFIRLGHRSRGVLLASLAGRWNGRVIEGGLFRSDRLEIQVDEIPGLVTFAENSSRTQLSTGWTRVHFDWPSERRLRVAPEGVSTRIRRFLGGSDLEFDDPAFDERFWVESSHPTWGRTLLDPEIRKSMVRLGWSPTGPFKDELILDVGPGGVSLRMSRVMVDDAVSLGSIIELGISILQKARGLADAVGVVLETTREMSGSSCPVCGHPVAGDGLPCATCRTPHHRDCWKYFGGCAIFACGVRARRTA
jgi:hypothetical protein